MIKIIIFFETTSFDKKHYYVICLKDILTYILIYKYRFINLLIADLIYFVLNNNFMFFRFFFYKEVIILLFH